MARARWWVLGMGWVALQGCGGDARTPTEAPVAGSADVKTPDFGGSGPGAVLVLEHDFINDEDIKATQLPISSGAGGLTSILTELTNGDVHDNGFFASVYKMDVPEELAPFDPTEPGATLNCFHARNELVFGAMFRSDGSRPDNTGGKGELSFGDDLDLDNDTLECKILSPTNTRHRRKTTVQADLALHRFTGFEAFRNRNEGVRQAIADDPANKDKPKSEIKKLQAAAMVRAKDLAQAAVSSLLKELPAEAKVYSCHWDNNDDTTLDGLVAVDIAGGVIRTLTAFVGP